MCGIAGIVDNRARPVDPGELKVMTDAIAHRGPDGEGVYTDGNVGLGHRRLAILDLSSAGAQPMFSRDMRYVVVFNGEIYNFKELRAELEESGYEFRTGTDTEVILYAYAAWGPECVERFNGMFAFALWDRRARNLFLARDRYGIKPLYYSSFDGRFVFGSEQKAFLTLPSFPRRLDCKALLEYFTFQNFFTDRTLYEGVHMFPPGSWALFDADGGKWLTEPRRYWDYDFREPENRLREEEYLEELDWLFQRAVKRQLVSDVDVGAYLSGGMDSGSITAVAAGEMPYIKSFTCGFDLRSASGLELGYDERENAEYMSYLFKTEHYEMVLKAGDMERVMPRLAWHLEEPRVGQSYPNYYAAKLASRFVKVVLAGTGGDELFGGYPWRYYRSAANGGFSSYVDNYYLFWQRLIPNKSIKQVFAPIWSRIDNVWTRDIFNSVFDDRSRPPGTPEEYVNRSLYFEAKTFLHGLLVVEDKLSMAHGLESRVPFLDNDLVDFAMRVPVGLKLGKLNEVKRLNENEPGSKREKYYRKNRDGKLLLRKAMRRYIPDRIADGAKQGFSAPDASWFKGESIRYVRETFFSSKARIFEYMDRKSVLNLVMEHLEGKVNRRLFIWSLLNFEWWLKEFAASTPHTMLDVIDQSCRESG